MPIAALIFLHVNVPPASACHEQTACYEPLPHIPIVKRRQVDARRDIIRDLVVQLHKARLTEARPVTAHQRHVQLGSESI